MLKVAINQIPNQYYTAKIKDKLLLMDNLAAHDVYSNLDLPTFKLDFVIAVFCISGRITLKTEQGDVCITASQCFIMLSDRRIDSMDIEPSTRMFTIGTVKDFFPSDNNINLLLSIKDAVLQSDIISLSEEKIRNIHDIYSMMKCEINDMQGRFTKEIVLKYIHILLYKICEAVETHSGDSICASTPRNEEVFNRFLALVNKHYRRHHDIKHYASLLCITPKYLSSICKRVSGKNAGEWIDSSIMVEATVLLRQKSISIKEIAYHLGFATQTQFSRFFKRHHGTTPTEFIDTCEDSQASVLK